MIWLELAGAFWLGVLAALGLVAYVVRKTLEKMGLPVGLPSGWWKPWRWHRRRRPSVAERIEPYS